MGLMILLNFALICVDCLAWPVIALGYPLFASIRAVEADSKYHMKKLIIYWTLFSSISLFEFALLKVIGWIPFWDSIRLIAIMWLVMPRFRGACHAYKILVRPVLSVDVQAVFDKLYKTKEDRLVPGATFLDVAEQYIKENGSEALERLIATSCITEQECKKSFRDVLVLEPEKKSDATSEQVQYADTNDGLLGPPPIKKCKQEWTCGLCKVTTTCEADLNAHLQGSKHRSNREYLKGSKCHAGDTRPWSWHKQAKLELHGRTNQYFYCNICSLDLPNKNNLASHVKGKRHMSNIAKIPSMILSGGNE